MAKKVFRLEVHGTAREVYHVQAKSVEEARDMFDRGEVTKPLVTEVESAEIFSVKELK